MLIQTLPPRLDVPVDGDTGGLDLPVGDVRRLQRLDAEVTEGDLGTATGHADPVRPVLLAVLDPAGNQHVDQTPVVSGAGAIASGFSSTAARPASVDVGVVPDEPERRRAGRSARSSGRPRVSPRAPRCAAAASAARCSARVPDLVALVDPDLHADPAEGRLGLEEAVVDVRPQGVQRHPTLAVELAAAHLGAAQASGALDPDALDVRRALRGLHGLAHGATEARPGWTAARRHPGQRAAHRTRGYAPRGCSAAPACR